MFKHTFQATLPLIHGQMSLLHMKNEHQFLKIFRFLDIDQTILEKYQQFLEVSLIWQALCGLKMLLPSVNQNNCHTGFILKIFKLCQTNYDVKKNWITKGIISSDQHLSANTGNFFFYFVNL